MAKDSSRGRRALDTQLHEPHTSQRPSTLTQWVKRLMLGRPLASDAALAHRLPIWMALPLFASDALSSIAYATQEILQVLLSAVTPQGSARDYLLPITGAIVVLMLIVAYSYRKAIYLYPTGGGSYAVARKNLGARAGLVTAAALVIDYCLTVAVSASAGMSALASYFHDLHPYKPYLAIGLVAFMAVINLRGIRESGVVFALPALLFVGSILLMIGSSIWNYLNGTLRPVELIGEPVTATATLGVFLLIGAFARGCSALTGVEAVSNGVQVFQPPESRNAAKTLLILIATLIVLFVGVGFAAHVYQATPTETETLIAQLARANFGHGFFYFMVIGSTLAILLVASNTVFAGMPQLLATLAKDGYAPRVLLGLGDRLVYSKSIIGLALISSILIWAFKAEESHMIPLYAVGVFLCFTMSQAGMFKRAISEREPGWIPSAAINGAGMTVTGIVMVVLAFSRLAQGSWLVVVLIPALVLVGYGIKRHYQWFEQRMSIRPGDPNPLAGPIDHLTVIVLLSSDIHRGTLEGLEAARAFVEGRKNVSLRALHIQMDPEKTKRLTTKWDKLVKPYIGHMIQLDIVPSPYRTLLPPIMSYLDRIDAQRRDDRIVVLLPEFETGGFWTHLLHNQTAPRLRQALFARPNVTVITNRFFMHDETTRPRLSKRRKAKG